MTAHDGPRLLFFSGGSALDGLSRRLPALSHNTVHLVTPFDSGGSSAALRDAFDMPAIGDLRQRLVALADPRVEGVTSIQSVFRYRFPAAADQLRLQRELQAWVSADRAAYAPLAPYTVGKLRAWLGELASQLPADFDLRGASVGNLILAGAYLALGRDLDAAAQAVGDCLSVRGTVRTIACESAHLAVTLTDGSHLIGQHRVSGKHHAPIQTPVHALGLSAHPHRLEPVQLQLAEDRRTLIQSAELICFAPGSFYSSLLATLLPAGVGRAVANATCPKVYAPSLGTDPEQLGMSLAQSVERLLAQLSSDAPGIPVAQLVNWVLVDSGSVGEQLSALREFLHSRGIGLIDATLTSVNSGPYYDNEKLLSQLLARL